MIFGISGTKRTVHNRSEKFLQRPLAKDQQAIGERQRTGEKANQCKLEFSKLINIKMFGLRST